MTEKDIVLVQESWALVLPKSDAAMEVFYDRLFALDADVAQLFAGKDMTAQHSQLANALDMVVRNLSESEALAQPLQKLGARHVAYGVSESDFATVGEALLSTLAFGLGDRWTDAQERAWIATWEMVSTQMLTGFHMELAA